jgi:hypothetical protein
LERAKTGNVRGDFSDAAAIICASAARGEGYRHGFIGNTGSGKTTAMKALLGSSSAAFTLIHDDAKRDAQYAGSVCDSFAAAPEDATTVIFRGDPFRGTVVEVEDVAALAVYLARARIPIRLVVDELDRACSIGAKTLSAASLRIALTQGRALGLSVLWSTQTPQRAPIEVIDQSSTIGICQLGPRALNYLDERLCFDADLLAIVPQLQTFEFVLYEQGRPWNRTIYTAPHDFQLDAT